MKVYIGVKVIKAEPMTKGEFEKQFNRIVNSEHGDDAPGYHVAYPNPGRDDYHAWSPADVFERAYREIGADEVAFISSPA